VRVRLRIVFVVVAPDPVVAGEVPAAALSGADQVGGLDDRVRNGVLNLVTVVILLCDFCVVASAHGFQGRAEGRLVAVAWLAAHEERRQTDEREVVAPLFERGQIPIEPTLADVADAGLGQLLDLGQFRQHPVIQVNDGLDRHGRFFRLRWRRSQKVISLRNDTCRCVSSGRKLLIFTLALALALGATTSVYSSVYSSVYTSVYTASATALPVAALAR
jgi:hypothetical protein